MQKKWDIRQHSRFLGTLATITIGLIALIALFLLTVPQPPAPKIPVLVVSVLLILALQWAVRYEQRWYRRAETIVRDIPPIEQKTRIIKEKNAKTTLWYLTTISENGAVGPRHRLLLPSVSAAGLVASESMLPIYADPLTNGIVAVKGPSGIAWVMRHRKGLSES